MSAGTHTLFTDPDSGEVLDAYQLKRDVTARVQALVGVVWKEVCSDYPVAPLTGLDIASKIVAAATAGAIKEQKDLLSAPFRPQQTKMPL